MLYWEHFFETEQQRQDIATLFDCLQANKYELFCLFDNAGVLIGTGDIQLLRQHHRYLASVYQGLTAINRGMNAESYYMDILACKAEKKDLVERVISDYNSWCGKAV